MQIVFDIGGTKLRIASSTDGQTLGPVVIFPTPQDFEEAMKLLELEIGKLANGQSITAIAGGVPAVLNADKTEIFHSANLSDWSGKPLAKRLTEIFNCPIVLENDGALGALGELHFGAGKDIKSLAYITIGTGIGGAWIQDDQLVKSTYNFDIGHQIIDPIGPLCNACQQPGHLEAYIKLPEFQKYLAMGLHNTLIHWPTENIILGGGVTLHSDWDIPKMESELRELMKNYPQQIHIKICTLGDEAGLYGALTLLS